MKLKDAEKHLLKLVLNGAGSDGWATVSKTVMPLVEGLPKTLVEVQTGRVRLTAAGKTVLEWLA